MANWSRTVTFYNGAWHEGNVPIMGVRTHGAWQASNVFDGGRVFEGCAPDLELHCARVNRSAKAMGLNPNMATEAILEIAKEGARKFAPGSELYVRPMYWGEGDGRSAISPDPDDIGFCVSVYEAAMPKPGGFSVTATRFRKPTDDNAVTSAKAGALYPNNARALKEANAKGFDNALMCDANGNVAETATSNVFMVKDGVVKTPIYNGTFLNGVTRQRVIKLLREAGQDVQEASLTYDDFAQADEIFISGNYSKVMPVLRIDERHLQAGPAYTKARKLYWEYAHTQKL